MNKDLTIGSPRKILWFFCLPLFASMLFQQAYNIADSIIAGRLISNNALAAVGNSYEITLFFLAFSFGLSIGASVIISKFFGEKDIGKVKTSVSTILLSGLIVAILLMLIGFLFNRPLLGLIHTPANIIDDSSSYLYIYTGGLIFLFLYNICNGVFQALGDSKTPFFFLAISSISNIFLDIIFVKYLHLGVNGLAWSTFLCQGISSLLAFIFLLIRLGKEKEKKECLFSFPILRLILSVAIPSIFQQSFISIGNIILQGTINSFGNECIAAYSASVKLNNLVITSLTTIGNGVSNFTSQNAASNQYDRVKSGLKSSIMMVSIVAIPIGILYFFFGKDLSLIFMEEKNDETLTICNQMLKILSAFYLVIAIKLAIDGVFRGLRHMGLFMASTATDLVLRVVLAITLSAHLGTIGIWISWPIGWFIALIISSISIYFIFREKKKQ